MSVVSEKPPVWFWIAVGLLLLWEAAGVFAFYAHVSINAAALEAMPAYDRQLYLGLPAWYNWVFAFAVWPALLGSIAMVMRSRFARPLFVVSLIAVIVQFGWLFGGTDLIAAKGAVETVPFPFVIFVLAVVQVWLAGVAIKRGWLR